MSNIGTATKAQQLSTALTLMGVQMNHMTCQIVLDLIDLLNIHGEKVSIGDIRKVVEEVQRKEQLKQNLTLGKGGMS